MCIRDSGISGSIEVQWNKPLNKENIQLFGFFDAGTIWDKDATTSAGKRNSLASTGVGVRLDLPLDVNAEFYAAQPINEDVQSHNDRDPRFFFSLNKSF